MFDPENVDGYCMGSIRKYEAMQEKLAQDKYNKIDLPAVGIIALLEIAKQLAIGNLAAGVCEE